MIGNPRIGAIIPVNDVIYNGKPAKYKVKFRFWWSYAYTLEEAEQLSEKAKSPEFANLSNYQ
jgi:hypothetical protein